MTGLNATTTNMTLLSTIFDFAVTEFVSVILSLHDHILTDAEYASVDAS